jgi:hypothetical protein
MFLLILFFTGRFGVKCKRFLMLQQMLRLLMRFDLDNKGEMLDFNIMVS